MNLTKIQPLLEIYSCIQSEASLAGRPHIIIRTTGCTHRCWFGEGGYCDTWYTSFAPEKGKYSLQDFIDICQKHPDINHLMITGGSPTMHPSLINDIVNIWHNQRDKAVITLETEGSHNLVTDIKIDLISLSPKFSNSIPKLGAVLPFNGKTVDQKLIDQHNKFRLNIPVIKELLSNHTDYHFKPVVDPYSQPEIWEEIVSFMTEMNIPKNKVWIMPPGDSKDELLKNYPSTLNFCAENGYNWSGRDHILAFGDKREV